MIRPHEILELALDYFTGGSHVTSKADDAERPGLMAMLRGACERAPLVPISVTTLLTAAHEGSIVEVDPGGGTVDVQLGEGLPVGFFAQVRQVGAGTARIVSAGAATIDVVASAASPISLAEQWAVATVEVRAANTWHVAGQLA